jgi:hypothetical protein
MLKVRIIIAIDIWWNFVSRKSTQYADELWKIGQKLHGKRQCKDGRMALVYGG